jgi:hypothetical protein
MFICPMANIQQLLQVFARLVQLFNAEQSMRATRVENLNLL